MTRHGSDGHGGRPGPSGHPDAPAGHASPGYAPGHPTGYTPGGPAHHMAFDMHSHLTVMAERVAGMPPGYPVGVGGVPRGGYKAAKAGRFFHVERGSNQIGYCGPRIGLVILKNM